MLAPSPVAASGYFVRPGDTLASIAARNGTTVTALARANAIADVNLVHAGRYLVIPGAVPSVLRASSAASSYYRVRWGDTMWGVATRFGMNVTEIRALNPSVGSYLLAGSWIRVCRSCGYSAYVQQPVSGARAATGYGTRYVVHRGDTLSHIALRFGISVTALIGSNGINNPSRILAGSVLIIPGTQATAQGSVSVPGMIRSYYPGLVRSLVASWGRTYGLPPSLPLAVAWQESGFNQSVVSPTGAVGVMQVEPYTGALISHYIGRPMALYNVNDNIQSGVFWLAHLVNYYGGNQRLAVAAYYQGSKALARYGYYPDTVRYVSNVFSLQGRFSG